MVFEKSDSASSVELHRRLRAFRSRIAVAEYDSPDYPVVAFQVDDARISAIGDGSATLDHLTTAVAEMSHYATELDRAPRDFEPDASKSPLVSAYLDSVMIPRAIHRHLSKENLVLSKGCLADAHRQQDSHNDSCNSRCRHNFSFHVRGEARHSFLHFSRSFQGGNREAVHLAESITMTMDPMESSVERFTSPLWNR